VEVVSAEDSGEVSCVPSVSLGAKHQIYETRSSDIISDSSDLTLRPLLIAGNSDLGQLSRWYEEYKSIKPQQGDSVRDVDMTSRAETAGTNTAAGLIADIATLDTQAQVPSKFLYVIAFSHGRPSSSRHEFSFDITDPDMGRLFKWVNRSSVRLSCVVHSGTRVFIE